MNRLRARVFSAVLAFLLVAGGRAPAGAQNAAPGTNFWFAGTKLVFDHAIPLEDDVAVTIRDGGLQKLLARLGATLAFQPQQRYVVVTSADRRVITFAVGDAHYTIGGVQAKAAFAPFVDGGDIVVPLLAIARALYVEPIGSGGETVLQPQLGALDVRPDGRRTIVTLRGATALKYTKLADTPERLQLAFTGIASTLAQARHIGGGVEEVDVLVGGQPRNPTATVTIEGPRGSLHQIAASQSPYEFTVVFGPPGVALDLRSGNAPPATVAQTAPAPATRPTAPPPGPVPAMPTPPADNNVPMPPAGTSGPAVVTNVAIDPGDDGVAVRLTINGAAPYEWHRLADNRWYVDIKNATLTGAGRDEHPGVAAVDSIRVRQIGTADAPVVRVAFTLRGDRRVETQANDGGLTLAVANAPETNTARVGTGGVNGASVAQTQPGAADPGMPPAAGEPPWKYGAPVSRSKVIVLDPGHGGGDTGTAHNGLVEKTLTLDIAMRLRALLMQAGWVVKMTRESDVDPLSQATLGAMRGDGKPNAEDRAYLQTRCDVANLSNARMFISIHVNYAPSASVNGTTFYYTKPQDFGLAQALERGLIPTIGTKDNGVIKANYYVTKHTTMPAVLVETAFISNPGDAARLGDPTFLQGIANGIAAGVRAYAGSAPTLSSKADQ